MDISTDITPFATEESDASSPRLDLECAWPSVIDAATCEASVGFALDPAMHELLSERLARPLRGLIDRGGKRWRMILGALAHGACRGTRPLTDPAFAAIELLHTASLVIDDIQDESEERRNGPAVHTLYGVPTALGAANTAYFRAFGLLAHLPDEQRLRAYDVFLQELHAAHVGQSIDLLEDPDLARHDSNTLRNRYYAMAGAKSGALVRMAGSLGAILADAPLAWEETLRNWGTHLGIAYQIVDDIDDLDDDTAGKDRRLSFPIVAGADLEIPLAHRTPEADSLLLARCHAAARDEANLACEALLALPNSPYRESLVRLTHALTQTEKS